MRAVVATASLELGIDIGTVDLVCQIGSPRSIGVALQRIGRSGHWVGARPKGRIFATTRDELVECGALVRAIRCGAWKALHLPQPWGNGDWQLYDLSADPGETVDVGIEIPERAFQHWSGKGWTLEPGTFALAAGSSSASLPLADRVELA